MLHLTKHSRWTESSGSRCQDSSDCLDAAAAVPRGLLCASMMARVHRARGSIGQTAISETRLKHLPYYYPGIRWLIYSRTSLHAHLSMCNRNDILAIFLHAEALQILSYTYAEMYKLAYPRHLIIYSEVRLVYFRNFQILGSVYCFLKRAVFHRRHFL